MSIAGQPAQMTERGNGPLTVNAETARTGRAIQCCAMADTHDPWDCAENALAYAEFASMHSTYRHTSRDLVDLAQLAADARVVDLACGTGITTEAVLAVLGERGSIVAVDASAAMLAAARSLVPDERVTWLRAPAEHLSC
jgi:SAM-dependent methyltransferase